MLQLLAVALTTDPLRYEGSADERMGRKRQHKCKSRSDIRWSTLLLYHITLGNGVSNFRDSCKHTDFGFWYVLFSLCRAKKEHTIHVMYHAAAGESSCLHASCF